MGLQKMYDFSTEMKIFGIENNNSTATFFSWLGSNKLARNCAFNNKEREEMGEILRRKSSID